MSVRKAGKVLLYGCAGLVLLMLLAMLAVELALDRAPAYQAQIKAWVHSQTGYYIGFAHVSPAFRWYGPELYFDRLELRSKDGVRVLARAAGGRVAVDIWQLLRSGKLLAGRIELDSPAIAITRVGPARFALASEIKLGGQGASAETLTLDDLPAGNLAIRHAVVTLQNWNVALPRLELQNVNVDLRRNADGIAVDLDARLPPALGGTFNLIGKARGAGDLQTLDWNIVAHGRGIAFPGWRSLLPEYLGRLDAGTGTFDLVARGQGLDLARADLDFAAHGVATQLRDGAVASFEQIGGSLSLIHAGDKWNLSGKRVRAQRAGHPDPDAQFEVSWRGSGAGLLELRARASYLRIETLLPLSGLLPDERLRERLREIAPTGEWIDTMIAMARGTVAEPWRLQVQAKFRDVGFAPVGRAPGLRGLSGSIAGNDLGGHVSIDTHTALFTWPAQLPMPVDLQTLKATLYWKRSGGELLVASPDWEMSNHDARVRAKVAWDEPGDGSSPVLTLWSTIDDGNVANVHNYLPRERIPPPTLAWLNRAFLAGRLAHADVAIQGPIRRFPFRDGSGTFLARCAFEGVTLDYGEGWPTLENLAAQAEFRNEGLRVRMKSGRIGGVPIDSADARFADFKNGELEIHAALTGGAADALAFLRASPLDGMAEHAFSNAEATGSLQATVNLFLPFKDFDNRRVLVHGSLEGATLNLAGSNVMATEVNGDFDIEGAQVTHADVNGRLLGGPFQMQARAPRRRPVTRTVLEFRGTLEGDALRSALSLPNSLSISGRTDWRAIFRLTPEPARERSLRVSSTLEGLEMKLPAPLDKPAATPLASWFEIQWPATGGPQGRLAFGSVVSGSYALESDANGTRLARIALAFGAGEASSNDTQIVNVGGSVGRLDLAGWLALAPTDKATMPLSDYLRSARLDVAELDYLGLAFRDVALDLAVTEGSRRITVSGPNVVGTITLPSSPDSAEPWSLQFQRLHFDVERDAEAHAAADALAAADPNPAGPQRIPAINFHAVDLAWGERQFGDVQATLGKLDDGVSLERLAVTGPSFTVRALGEWRGKDAGSARIVGTLTSSDVQDTLKQLGYAEIIDAKDGHMDFDLNWAGAPTAAALSDARGHVQLALDKGQIVGLKPGAGRMLGLASIAALPRRLALDFSDLTDKGLAFDTVRADFDLRDGNAYTENLLVKGPAAEIGLIGRVGLKNRDYDQTAVVTGNLGSSPLPLAGFVGGPVVGAAVLVFYEVFKQPLKGLARGYYRITGSWDNPTVERIKEAPK